MLFRNLTSGNLIEVNSKDALELISSSPYYERVHRAPEKPPTPVAPEGGETVKPAQKRAGRPAKAAK